ncbi:MAG: hypothetical protein WC764_01950 [Candidatus Paceibacterota bacterium]
MNQKTPVGPIIGSGIVVLVLVFGAASLISKVFAERAHPTVLPTITEYQRIDETASTSPARR